MHVLLGGNILHELITMKKQKYKWYEIPRDFHRKEITIIKDISLGIGTNPKYKELYWKNFVPILKIVD